MTQLDFIALLPHLSLGILALVLIAAISLRRNHGGIAIITAVGLLLCLISVYPSLSVLPRQVSPLLSIDAYSAFFTALFILIALVTVIFSYHYLLGRRGDQEEYYLLLVIATLGAVTLASAAHFATVILGLEILSISLYALIAYPEEHHAPLEAALKYLVLSGVASTTSMFGMAFIYQAVGGLGFADVGAAIANHAQNNFYLIAGNAMFIAGLMFKLSLVPFHLWTPDVYQGAPAPVTGFLSTASKAAVVALLLRYFATTQVLSEPTIFAIVSLLAGLSMVVGNLLALLQNNIKRLLAYSSIAHLGYLLIGLLTLHSLSSLDLAIEASMVYVLGYTAMTLAAFGVVTLLSVRATGLEAEDLSYYRALFWRRPILAAVLTITFLSLAGIPLTLGFIAKFYLLAAGIEGGLWILLWTLIIGSSIAIYYYLRIIFTMTEHLEKDEDRKKDGVEISFTGLCTAIALSLLLLVFGIFPAPLISLVQYALDVSG